MKGKRTANPPTELFTRLDKATDEALLREARRQGLSSRAELLLQILTGWASDAEFQGTVEVPAPKNRGPRTAGHAFVRPTAEIAQEMMEACPMPNRLFYAVLVAWAEKYRRQ